jgi:hypothetical protein
MYGIIRGFLFSTRTYKTASEDCAVALSCRRFAGPTFLKLGPNAMNPTDKSLNRLFITFAIYNVLLAQLHDE